MGTPEEAKVRAARTYNAAADHFDDPANTFWDHFGRRTIAGLNLGVGMRVLDVCCGTGASAIPAAEAVGPTGHVLGVDLAENLLALGRAKAQQHNLSQLEFRAGDMLALDFPDSSFDTVVCVLGIFFVPDMEGAARELWRMVKPGGQLAITTWGPRLLAPMDKVFWNAIRAERPDLYRSFNPWDRIAEPSALGSMLAGAGIPAPRIVPEDGLHPLPRPEAWWALALGSGYRATLDQLDADSRERVRRANLDHLRQSGLTAVETNAIYAVATKP